ncbi:hypothetical protein SLS58_003615 [Diplodia intermedia]|uniref:Uncharacterized protein n=1 Tax=Diplodia intermedia TaxID=856260 RepID=A0ABR3TVU0_9PEZI
MLITPPPLALVHVIHSAALADLAVDLYALDALDEVPAERAEEVTRVLGVVREEVANKEGGERLRRGRAEALEELLDARSDVGGERGPGG